MENALLIVIGATIGYQSYQIIKNQRQLRKDMKSLRKANDDLNIEFSAIEGTGITQVKKEYPDIVMRDDFRESTDQVSAEDFKHVIEPHSIAGGMNDPSEMQKKAFDKENLA